MTDIELIKSVMNAKEWKQADIARYLGIGRSQITKVLRYGQKVHPASRKLLEQLLEMEEEEKLEEE